MRLLGQWEGQRLPWRRWFAWRPVTLGLHGRTAWLRYVSRRVVTHQRCPLGAFRDWHWEYRE